MSYDLVVRGGTVVTASDSTAADIGVRAGRVAAIGEALAPGTAEIAAAGLLVLPGGVDVHTHLDAEVGGVRTADDFETGTVAAACGGITTICDYAWQSRGQSLMQAIEAWKAKAEGRAHVDYGFHVVVSDAADETLAEMPRLVAAGYPSVKVFMINEFGIGDEALLRLFGAARAAGAIVNVHAENGDMLDHCARGMRAAGRLDPRYYAESRPALAEAEATRRAIDYAALVGAEVYIVHLSCADALEAVSAARRRGIRVWAETRPIYLALTEERYAVGAPRRRSSSGRRRSGPASIRPRSGTACARATSRRSAATTRRGRWSRSPRAPATSRACPTASPASRRRCASSTPRGWPRGASRSRPSSRRFRRIPRASSACILGRARSRWAATPISCSSIPRGRAWWTSGSFTRAPAMTRSTDSIWRVGP